MSGSKLHSPFDFSGTTSNEVATEEAASVQPGTAFFSTLDMTMIISLLTQLLSWTSFPLKPPHYSLTSSCTERFRNLSSFKDTYVSFHTPDCGVDCGGLYRARSLQLIPYQWYEIENSSNGGQMVCLGQNCDAISVSLIYLLILEGY